MADNSTETLLARRASKLGDVSVFLVRPFQLAPLPQRFLDRYPEFVEWMEKTQTDVNKWTEDLNTSLAQALASKKA